MNSVRLTITINRPAHDVFDFTINPENTPKWIDDIIKEQVNETPTKLGTVYKNQSQDGNWREFEITDYKFGASFAMSEKDSNMHVKYTFKSLNDKRCEVEYCVWVDSGDLNERFTQHNLQHILQKLKDTIETL